MYFEASELHYRRPHCGRTDLKRRIRLHELLPYGMWTCPDGSEVLFNRYYEPIWRRTKRSPAHPCAFSIVSHVRQRYFYDETEGPGRSKRMRSRLEGVLGRFVSGGPVERDLLPSPANG